MIAGLIPTMPLDANRDGRVTADEFMEFSVPVTHHTKGGVNVLNLIEGRGAVVESPSGAFEPYVVHCCETFVIPATVGEYRIRPYG